MERIFLMSDRSSVFPRTDAADWWQIIRKELKGRPEETLFTEWWEGFQTPPFHSAEEPRPVDPLFGAYPWHASSVVGPDDLPASALEALNNGADGLRIQFRPDADLTRSLKGIQLEFLRIELLPGELSGTWIESWKDILASADKKSLNTALGFSLWQGLSSKGSGAKSFQKQLTEFRAIGAAQLFRHPILIDCSLYAEAGARMDTQLGIALSMAHEVLEEDPSLSPEHLHFRFSLGRNFLLETAKLRAFRELWSFYLDSLGRSRTEAFVNARNSLRPLSASDTHGNLLRLTTMAASGLLGGAQNMELTDHTLGGPKDGEAHLPVNILHLLRFEGRLDRLEDPLAGSHSIEALTERLAETGWSAFQEIQRRGSASQVLCDPWFAQRVAEEAEAEQKAHDQGQYPVIGSSLHPFGSVDMKLEASTSLWPLRRLAEGAEKVRSK